MKYRLTTFEPGDGAQPGEYLIQVMKYEQPPLDAAEEDYFHLKNQLPEKYAAEAKSGLSATVAENHNNVVDFEL